jgi:hypothetical protein
LDIIDVIGVMSPTWKERGGKNAVVPHGLVSSPYPEKNRNLFERNLFV